MPVKIVDELDITEKLGLLVGYTIVSDLTDIASGGPP